MHSQTHLLTSCLFPPSTFFNLISSLLFFLLFPLHHFLHLLIILPYYLSLAVSPSPDPLSKLVSPSECQSLDREAPTPSTSQVQRHPMNFFTGRAGVKFQGTAIIHTAYTNTHLFSLSLSAHYSLPPSFFCFHPLFLIFSWPLLSVSPSRSLSPRSHPSHSHSFPPSPYLSSPVSELSLADAPDGSIILEHLSAVCLHHGSSAATGATEK